MANKAAKGKRSKTRSKLRKRTGKLSVNKLLEKFEVGKKAEVCIDSSVHSGMPDARYMGFTGKVVGMQGKAVNLEIEKGSFSVNLVVHPAHLRKVKAVGSKEAA